MIKLDERIRPVLEEINFIERYRNLSYSYADYDNKLKHYANDEVLRVASELGYRLSFNGKENFFKYIQKTDDLALQLNISLKYGSVELILDVVKGGERYQVGGPFGLIVMLMGESERIKYPAFASYDELSEILKEAFGIYEEIKEALLKLS